MYDCDIKQVPRWNNVKSVHYDALEYVEKTEYLREIL